MGGNCDKPEENAHFSLKTMHILPIYGSMALGRQPRA
jgi:hypothetical protein